MPADISDKKVAIVCDWLTGIGGAERVVLELHKMFPNAPIYTSQYDPKKIDWFVDADVRTGWLQKFPKSLKKFLPVLRAWYFSHLDLSDYDLVISETGAEAKAVKFSGKTKHICILNAPTHYYWSRYESYMKEPGFGAFNWLARISLKLLVGPMRRWDYKAAQKPTQIVSISSHIKTEIEKYYSRDSELIHPPVDMSRFIKLEPKNQEYFIITGRQTPYKRIDLAVQACTELNVPLLVIGDGPENEKLRELAGPSIAFETNASDKRVEEALAGAQAFIFPGLDDFGISAVEPLATGIPVIAYHGGGALDYIVPGETGEFFYEQTRESLVETVKNFDYKKYPPKQLKTFSQQFSVDNFNKNLINYLQTIIKH